MSMRIIRVLHAGFFSIALAGAMIGVGGGCGDSPPATGTVAKEAPGEAEARAKNISNAYKTSPPTTPKGQPAPTPPAEKKS
jgi:hypothetical protein